MFERQNSNSRINFIFTMDDKGVQVVPTLPTSVTLASNGNIPNLTAMCGSYDSDQVGNIYNSEETNIISTDAMYALSAVVQESEKFSIMDLYDGIKDKNLMEAATRAMADGTMTPLIKEELKYSIQSKRLKEGKPELKIEFTEPEPDQLTPEELERVEKRKEQNRLAARRFRDRQKTRGDHLQKECQRLQSEQTRLKFELSRVKTERDGLRKALEDHMATCPYKHQLQLYTQTDKT